MFDELMQRLGLPLLYGVLLAPYFDKAVTYTCIYGKNGYYSFTLKDREDKNVCVFFVQGGALQLNSPFWKGVQHYRLRLLRVDSFLAIVEHLEIRFS